eukprot:CAMPEP_0172195474 /NCGR_PEP_ID=MMETSP1050-20130122/26227_1 /TAXON_ID=233186 /ORGANISM="Cryptomonas curvata, Strain CCAP979/52" /LENGTH=221 /DNA_ID=CAMNT_0012871539 /DNA_START=86 /DNA_END=748 /DNA_ORIENTATION=-
MTSTMPKILSPFSILRRKRRERSTEIKHRVLSPSTEPSSDPFNVLDFSKAPCEAEDQGGEQYEAPKFHSNLLRSLQPTETSSLDDLVPGIIPRSVGLQTAKAEKEYRAARTVHNSPLRPISHSRRRPSTKQEVHQSSRPMCCIPSCRLIGISEHMEKFQHLCKFGDLCKRFLEHEAEHCRHYKHQPLHAALEGRDRDSPLPSFSAAKYQSLQPRLSCCPRA